MTAITTENRITLLRELAQMGGRGRAEGESSSSFARRFYPVPEHARALEPDVVLIVGPRGAGKTEIFRASMEFKLLPAILREVPSLRVPENIASSEWLKAFPLERHGFDPNGLRRFLDEVGEGDQIRDLWFTYLARVLYDRFDDAGKADLHELSGLPGGAPIDCYQAFIHAKERPLLALDRLDERLEKEDRFLFVGYDELDILGGADWGAMSAAIRGLVAFWSGYARRWRRVRPKIFLRTDLFEQHATSGGADLAKLAAGRVDLAWSDRNLYSMLLKRIANTSVDLWTYIQAAGQSRFRWSDDADLGHVPHLRRWEDGRPIIERMVGQYMGANFKKGHVYRWIVDHIRDGKNRALPRPSVRLIEEAAQLEAASPNNDVRPPRLMHPTSFRRALDRVSDEHVAHALSEWPWIDGLRNVLKGQHVPWERGRELEKLLEMGIETTWKTGPKPPFPDGSTLVEYLIEIGVFRLRADARIDVPDLFLSGLGLKRKGGVRRI